MLGKYKQLFYIFLGKGDIWNERRKVYSIQNLTHFNKPNGPFPSRIGLAKYSDLPISADLLANIWYK